MPRTLILGANGQLGAALTRRLGPEALPATRADFNFEDPGTTASFIATTAPEAVLCIAAATDVERCETEPVWAETINTLAPAALAKAAYRLPFVYISTDYVFDGHAGPYAEQATPDPINVYGRTKLAGEQAVLAAHPCALIVRTTGVFGPDAQHKNFLYTLSRVLRSGGTMRVPTDQLSNPTYNEDLAAAILALLACGASGLFHAGGPELLSRYAFAQRAASILKLDTTKLLPVLTPVLNQRAARPLLSGLINKKLITTLGHDPMRPLDDAMRAWQTSQEAHP